MITRAIQEPLVRAEQEAAFSESVLAVRMNKRKMPAGRDLTSKNKVRKQDFNLTPKADGVRDLSSYKYTTVNDYEKELFKLQLEDAECRGDLEEIAQIKAEMGVLEPIGEEGGVFGNMIPQPSGGKKLEQYIAICQYLNSRRGQWVALSQLRDLFRTNKHQEVKVNLHDGEGEFGCTGLVWRKNGRAVEYCLN